MVQWRLVLLDLKTKSIGGSCMELKKIHLDDLVLIEETIENADWGWFCRVGIVCGGGCFGGVCIG
jgi:hypothetical protein